MKLSLETHGGQIAAINLHRPPLSVNTRSLPPSAVEELERLVAAVTNSPLPPKDTSELARDQMSYTITIENGKKPLIIAQADSNMSSAFRELRNWIQAHSRGS
jgi:hypothetical protein